MSVYSILASYKILKCEWKEPSLNIVNITMHIDGKIGELNTSAMSTISLLWSRSCSSCCSLMLTSVLKSSIRFMMVSAVSRVMVLLYRFYSLSIEVLLRNWADHDISWLNKCKIVTTATTDQQQRQKPVFSVTFRHWAGRQRGWVTRDRGCWDHEIIGASESKYSEVRIWNMYNCTFLNSTFLFYSYTNKVQ